LLSEATLFLLRIPIPVFLFTGITLKDFAGKEIL
jgi:hypothetical protein